MCKCWGQEGSGRSCFPCEGNTNPRKPQASHVQRQTPVVPLSLLLLGALHWGLCAANAAALLAGSPHTSAPQEAGGGGAVLLPTSFPGSKSKSLFL